MTAAHGFEDGEVIPLDFVLRVIERITSTVGLPVTVDFEGGYTTRPQQVVKNVRRVIQAGAVGINFEDRVVGGEGLLGIQNQVERIDAVRHAVQKESPFVINARTDLFLGTDPKTHSSLITAAIDHEAAYREAGADGFFAPRLPDPSLIETVVDGERSGLGCQRPALWPQTTARQTLRFARSQKQL
ncbi:isocitrate lyase/phosphoenolpyruvate mutase family protein [Aliiroseovarius halocynthiae]|uniref:Isocitrate lyase/phosphoenolpyruvate mutase family protein n=1 Tax=Aliiroseovarius halocynthiae TaxID=985055 RepID=A0A545SQH4_9RHOB|nr:isocitrate lyase/phosphoenolpyruvate mutase family protein [Aliiroseovarius halocynthiae]TQV67207.1 isocitrate lyase/phosphoenolpyruvate mutase family protein [Aliiroseovarius halocynthiae]